MTVPFLTQSTCALLALSATALCLSNEESDTAPIAGALTESSEQVRLYNDHLTILASPYMEGRLPGTQGMERAKDYMEYWFRQSGLEAPFTTSETVADGTEILTPRNSFRQPFELAGQARLIDQAITFNGMSLRGDEDFNVSAMGSSDSVTAPVVFVGYGIDNGDDGYSSFASDDQSLEGRIALMLRFEPMDAEGKSLWGGAPWSNKAGFANKLRAMRERGAAGVIIVNTPGAADSRAETLPQVGRGNSQMIEVPMAMMMPEAAEKILAAGGADRTLMDMRRMADAGSSFVPLDVELTLTADIDTSPMIAENVGALLPGKGMLADEIVVLGAHLDHLGTGEFGSRSGPGPLHPGADDNASGSAAVLMLADRLAKAYDELPSDANARTLLFIGFSAEESGLNGSRHYAENPIESINDHVLMMNFDMIGRITNKRLSVSGGNTGVGMRDWLQPYFDASPLEIVAPENMSGASDHTSFYRKGMPVLFGIIADFHDDYHTPRDESWKINRVGAVHTIDLFEQLLFGAATKAERFVFNEPAPRNSTSGGGGGGGARSGGPEMNIKVRFGIMPGNYDEGESGVLVGGVSDDTSASDAGIQEGDVLVKWNGDGINDVMAWMGMLSQHEPGDKVQVTVLREQEEKVLWVTLKGREQGGR